MINHSGANHVCKKHKYFQGKLPVKQTAKILPPSISWEFQACDSFESFWPYIYDRWPSLPFFIDLLWSSLIFFVIFIRHASPVDPHNRMVNPVHSNPSIPFHSNPFSAASLHHLVLMTTMVLMAKVQPALATLRFDANPQALTCYEESIRRLHWISTLLM